MFDDKTFENLMEKAMGYAPHGVDTQEGSVFYDVAAPLCMLLAEAYADLLLLQNQMIIPTATGTWLEAKGEEYGIEREQATPWVYEFSLTGATVETGERFFCNDYYYTVVEIEGTQYLQCETSGTVVSKLTVGTAIVPVNTIDGLTAAAVGSAFRYATDTETDEQLRERLQEALAQPSENANVAQVKRWAEDFEGVKSAIVYGRSIYNADTRMITGDIPNRVAVFLNIRSDYGETAVVNAFQEYIDPNEEGNGEGVGIIGTVYSVYPLVQTGISLSCKLFLTADGPYTPADTAAVTAAVCSKLTEYFTQLVDELDDDYLYIYRDNVKAVLQEIEGVAECESTSIVLAGSSTNLKLPSFKRPVISVDETTLTLETEASDDDFEEL